MSLNNFFFDMVDTSWYNLVFGEASLLSHLKCNYTSVNQLWEICPIEIYEHARHDLLLQYTSLILQHSDSR